MAGEISLTDDQLAQFEYDPLTGEVLYLVTGRPFCGQANNGSWVKVHRLAWRLQTGEWPEGVIDHINGDPTDNRFENLRDVPQRLNSRNQKKHSRNTSGQTGVYWRRDVARWQARISTDEGQKSLGYFDTFEEAVETRKTAERENEYHINHGEQR